MRNAYRMTSYIRTWPELISRIGRVQTRKEFDTFRTNLIRAHGMSIPQEINDALTRKHLELKKRGE